MNLLMRLSGVRLGGTLAGLFFLCLALESVARGQIVVIVTPASTTLSASQTQQFTANVFNFVTNNAVTWSINPNVGSVSASGLYTAPALIPSGQTVTVTATSVEDPTKSGSATVTLTPVAVSVSPPTAILSGGGTQQFTATVTGTGNTAVTWTVSPVVGSVSPSGFYTAPANISSTQTVTVTATSVFDGTKSGSASVTLNASVAVSVSPASANLNAGGTQQFTATVTGTGNTGVTWSINPNVGSISSAGLYTAPNSVNASQTVTVTATSVADNTKSGFASISLIPVSVSVGPSSVSLGSGGVQQFNATVNGATNSSVIWSISPGFGSISTTGLYTAPSPVTSNATIVVTATSIADATKSASAMVTLVPVLVFVSPSIARLMAGETLQFTAAVTGTTNTNVSWSLDTNAGGISNTGFFTAPSSIPANQTVTVTATSIADKNATGSASLVLVASAVLSVSCSPSSGPSQPGVAYSASCTASGGTPPFSWSISSGTLPAGLSLSPSTGTTVTVSGTPALAAAGSYSYSVKVTDNGTPAPETASQSYIGTITAPPVSASPGAFNFSGITDGASTTAVITVGASVAGQPFTAGASTSSGGNWLRVSASTSTTPGAITVTADPSGLPAGIYQGSVNISVPSGNPTSLTVAVTFNVQASTPPQLRATPSGLSFALVQGGLPSTRSVAVSNGGSGAVQATASATTSTGGNWLSVSPSGGMVSATSPLSLVVTADPSGLAPGTYSGSVSISSSNSNASVAVTLSVSGPAPNISLSEAGFTFYGVAGLGAGPSQTLTVSNTGSQALSFNASASVVSGGPWLTVSPTSGTASGGTNLQVTANSTNLSAGDYYGSINVTGSGAPNSPQTAAAVLHVVGAGSNLGVTAAPAALVFVQPGSQTISLSTAGAGTFKAALTDDYGSNGSFFTHSPSSGTVTIGNPLTVTVQVDNSSRKPGIYTGALIVSTDDGVVRKVTVILVVPVPPTGSANARATAACVATQLIPVATTFSQSFSVSAGFPTPLEVLVVDDCGSFHSAGSVGVTFSNGDPPVSLSQQGDGRWSGTWTGVHPGTSVVLTVLAQSRDLKLKGIAVFGGAVAANPLTPILTNIVNGASFANNAPLAPGSFVSLFGSKLAQGQVATSSIPFPILLAGASVTVGANQAPLFFTSDGQLNAIVPYGLAVNTTHPVLVQRENTLSGVQNVSFAAAAPGIFSYNGNEGVILGVDSSGNQTLADSSHPVSAKQNIVIYCTGLGEVNPPVPAGSPAPLNPLSNTVSTVTLTIGGIPASVGFAGLSPGSVGLYQVNAAVPSGVTPGDNVQVVLMAAGQSSAPVLISVR